MSATQAARRGRVVCLVQLCICQLIQQAMLRLCARAKEASCEKATWRAAAGHTRRFARGGPLGGVDCAHIDGRLEKVGAIREEAARDVEAAARADVDVGGDLGVDAEFLGRVDVGATQPAV